MKKQIIEVTNYKKYVRGGPHLYVSKLLHTHGPIGSTKIWEEYLKDNTVIDSELIKSKNHLKARILPLMLSQGKIERGPALNMNVKNSKWGYKLVPHKAF